MKKKYLTVVTGLGVIIAVSVIWLLNRPKTLGSIKHSFFAEPTTNTSTISFFAEKNDRLRFYVASDIKQGNLEIVLYDSKGNPVEELDQAREQVTYLTMRYDDTYTLAVQYTDFVGSFKAIAQR